MWIECNLTEEVEDGTTDSDACDRFDSWDSMNEPSYGCDITSDWNASWCNVQGGAVDRLWTVLG